MNRAFIGSEGRISRKAVWGGEVGYPMLRLLGVLFLTALTASCGDVTREGTGSSYLVIQSFEAASGAEPGSFSGTLNSDVVTIVDDVPGIFNDVARVNFALVMKDPGSTNGPSAPTSANWITLNRYHVQYIRADGRNTPGVDVPSGFDGAITGTVSDQNLSIAFELVRHIAKEQAPLAALARNPTIITTICEVTFYGRDQTGRDVSVKASLMVNFGNFGDPA
jgi:hypothetical protein